ncbi:heterokaryon incompatibility protein-domain-containing protein [Dactylonectria macrodidyma]|uniref:Heterokaryon incompatibility protein-domain-containing protein n=1 Tax=Dactylonectria macrodidyma TaxID=307937 RepID=A0A9P9ETA1_9HYPO|nr:heterokaryon incompatibility protein-domain-containing protein [Dactylonectria macrodidyma]
MTVEGGKKKFVNFKDEEGGAPCRLLGLSCVRATNTTCVAAQRDCFFHFLTIIVIYLVVTNSELKSAIPILNLIGQFPAMPWDSTTNEWIYGPQSWCRTELVTGQSGFGDETVITVPSAVKNQTLTNAPSLSLPVRQKGEAILKGIHNAQVASLFGLKDNAVSDAPFRLVKQTYRGQQHQNLVLADSYIALSYCWHNPTWLTAGKKASGSPTKSQIPISEEIFTTILNERRSENEGIWIDQLCINQTDAKEKAVAIGSMDVIYQCARLVAVVIEDVTISKSEILALQSVLDTINRGGGWQYRDNFNISRTLTELTSKIFSARWFTRAWCGHELLMSTNQVFFITAEPEDQSRPLVVKMSSEFLLDLCILAKSVSSVFPSTEFVSLESTYARSLARFYTYTLRRLNPGKIHLHESNSLTPSYLRTFSQVFGFDASVVSDKLSIVLNVLQCGLYLKDSIMTQEQCLYAIYHLALSARDPTCLSTCGKSLQQAAWMRWPRGHDIIEPYVGTSSRHLCLEITPRFQDDAMELDFVILGTTKSVHRAKSRHMAWAEAVVKKCVELADEFPDKGNEFLEDIIQEPHEALERRQFYSEILACIREFGMEWLEANWQLKDPDHMDPDIISGLGLLMTTDAQAIDAFLPSQWDDLVPILHLVDGLTGAWIIEEPGTLWKPAWVETSDNPNGLMLFLCPDIENCSVAIPTLLLRAEHGFLKRIWFIVPKNMNNVSGKDFEVIGKSSSFGRVALEDLRTKLRVETHRLCM